MKTICAECKKSYKGYIIILCDNIECFIMDNHIRDIYYHEKEDSDFYEENQGLCELCRKKIEQDNIWKVQNWFNVELQIQCVIVKLEKEKDKGDSLKKYQEALIRVKNIIKEAEEDPIVQAMYKKNNPAEYMKIPKDKIKCNYCGENYGQKWINNPNNEDCQKDVKEEKCWWVCIPCEKIMELQIQDSFLGHFESHVKDMPKLAEKVGKQRAEVSKKIDAIAHEDGQEVYTAELSRQENGKYKVKEKLLGNGKGGIERNMK